MNSLPFFVFAATETGAAGSAASFDLTSIMTEATNTVQGQIFTTLAIVVPALVLVTGAVVGIRFGIKWLRQLGKG